MTNDDDKYFFGFGYHSSYSNVEFTGTLFIKELKEKSKSSPINGERKFLSIIDDNTVAIIIYDEERSSKFYKLLTYTMEGNLLKVAKFNPSLREIRELMMKLLTYLTSSATQVTIFIFYEFKSKLVIEIFSAVTRKLQLSLTMNTNYNSGMFDGSVRFNYHVNGNVF